MHGGNENETPNHTESEWKNTPFPKRQHRSIAPSLRWKGGNRVCSVVFVLTAAFAPFLAWIAIGNIIGEQGDGTFSLAVVITWQNCLIIVMLAAVLERLNRR